MQTSTELRRGARTAMRIAPALLLVMGCADSLSPKLAPRTFALETFDGSTLPAVEFSITNGPQHSTTMTVHADTVTFAPYGRGEWGGSLRVLYTLQDGSVEVESFATDRSGFSWEDRDSAIEITFDPPPGNENYDYILRRYRAQLVNGTLFVESHTDSHVQVFRRVE